MSADFCFLGQSEDTETAPVFVLRDHRPRVTFAHVVHGKSTIRSVYSQYLTKAVVADFNALGHKKIIFKTDQPAMVALQESVKVASDVEITMRNSPVGESQSNGVVEKAVRDIEDEVRTLKAAIEDRLGIRLETKSPMLTWLVEHAAWLYKDCNECKDHKTAVERLQGGRSVKQVAEFRERILYKPLSSSGGRIEN